MYKTGTEKETLLQVLESLSGLTSIDRLIKSRQSIRIDAELCNGSLNWVMEADHESYGSKNIAKKRGKGYASLEEAVSNLDMTSSIDDRIVVLALADTSEAKNYDGTVNTVWYAVDPVEVGMDDPAETLDLKHNVAVLKCPILQIRLTEAEYKCCQTRLAFYDEMTGTLFPILQCALPSIGNLLNSESAIRCRDRVPLACASILAERIYSKEGIRFIYRERTKKVKPLISIVGGKYVLYPQDKFIRECLSIAQSHSVCHVGEWAVSDECTRVDIVGDSFNSVYQTVIRIQTSDIVGQAIAVEAYARIGNGSILLRRNPIYHWLTPGEVGVDRIFDGIFEAIDAFAESFSLMCGETVVFSPKSLEPFKNVLGKKRFSAREMPPAGTYPFPEILYKVINGMDADDLNEKFRRMLAKEGAVFYNTLCGYGAITTGNAKPSAKKGIRHAERRKEAV